MKIDRDSFLTAALILAAATGAGCKGKGSDDLGADTTAPGSMAKPTAVGQPVKGVTPPSREGGPAAEGLPPPSREGVPATPPGGRPPSAIPPGAVPPGARPPGPGIKVPGKT